MATLLKNERARIVLLNGTLLVLFGCAWVADRWPDLSLAAVFVGFCIVMAEAVLLYFASKKTLGSKTALPALPPADLVHYAGKHKQDETESDDLILAKQRAAIAREHALVRRRLLLAAKLYKHRSRASQVTTWALTDLEEDRMRVFAFSRQAELWPEAKQFERWSTALETRRAASKELATWKLHEHGEEAFNIIAGAFVIEHFHGRTNIRILDSTRVTVESENRGQKSSIAPLGINAAVYQ